MPNPPHKHAWIHGPWRSGRLAALVPLGDFAAVVDCDRRRRGPYTGAGAMLRVLVPAAHEVAPELVARHRIEILCAAPELAALVGPVPWTLAPPEERTRWHSRLRTRRISHGLVDFLRDYAARCPGGRLALAFDTLTEADRTDQEFVAIALRRLEPARVYLAVGTREVEPPAELAAALRLYGRRLAAPVPPAPVPPAPAAPAGELAAAADVEETALAAAYIGSDGTSDVPAQRAAYLRLEPRVRAELHDARAAELARTGEFSAGLGALVYHRCRGTDPAGAGYPTGWAALTYCRRMGYYDTVLELADRLLALVDRYPDRLAGERYPLLTATVQALTMLERAEAAEPLLWDLLAGTDDPQADQAAHYQLGILYSRHSGDPRADHRRAMAHLNTAAAIAGQLPDPQQRGLHAAFLRTGLALAELHLGNPDRAGQLMSEGLDRLDREPPPEGHPLHRCVLLHHRARVLAGLGRTAEAIADLDRAIEADPYHAEYHVDRGNARRRAGDPSGAIADYEHAMTLTPPFPDLFYHRGDARLALGDTEGAAADFRYVLDLEPDHLPARIALAALLLAAGAAVPAADQVRAGLVHHPEHGRLLCLLGQAAVAGGDAPCALIAFDRALVADPTLHQALVCRAALACEQGRFDAAVADLDRALELAGDDPVVLSHRGYAHAAAGRPLAAIADYERALTLPGAARADLLARRDECLAAAAAPAGR